MKFYESKSLEIREVATNMVAMADRNKEAVITDFYGIVFTVNPGSRSQDIVDHYYSLRRFWEVRHHKKKVVYTGKST